jgi:hypothetical protein
MVAGVSFNGGNSWQSVVIPGLTTSSGGSYPVFFHAWVSFTPNGDVYASGLGNESGTNLAMWVSKSTDGGLTWGAPTTIVTAGHNEGLDKDSITADPSDAKYVYATWRQSALDHGGTYNHGAATMFSRTTDGGQTWEPARTIFNPGPHNYDQNHMVVVLPDGTLVNFFSLILYKSDTGGIAHYDTKLSLLRSSDHGQTWLPTNGPIPVADILALTDTDTVPGMDGVPDPDGGNPIKAPNPLFDVAVDPTNGNLYAVWQDTRFSNGQYNSIAFAMSTDGGFTWSIPIKINLTPDTIPIGNRQAFIPSVAVAADGTVAVTYYDFRNNTSAPGLPTDYWMIHADAKSDLTNPASWRSENRLTNSSFDLEQAFIAPEGWRFLGDYMGLSAAGNAFAALWAMPHTKSDGTTDPDSIFFRDPSAPVLATVADGGGGRASMNFRVGAADLARALPGPIVPPVLAASTPAESTVPPLASQRLELFFAVSSQESPSGAIAERRGIREGTGDGWGDEGEQVSWWQHLAVSLAPVRP